MIENWHFKTLHWNFFAELPKKEHTYQVQVMILLLNDCLPLAISTFFLLFGIISNLLTDPKWVSWWAGVNSTPTASCFYGFMCAQFRNPRHPTLIKNQNRKEIYLCILFVMQSEFRMYKSHFNNNKNSLLAKVPSVSLVKIKALCTYICLRVCMCTQAHTHTYAFVLIIYSETP